MRFSVRFLFTALIFFVFALFFKPSAFAQSNYQNINNSAVILNTNPDVPKNLNTLSQSILIDVLSSLSCQLTGINPVSPKEKCLGIDTRTGKIGYVENGKGLLGLLTNGITMLYTPPIHTVDYFRYLSANFGISKSAYAQNFTGVGLTTIAPISGLWQTFRNIVYLFFVVVFVAIGVGIMLRTRIDPRTVMTIQNQIPKIIIALILITFSFAISGLLIDIMWVVILLVINVFTPLIPGLPQNYITPFGLVGVVPGGILGVAGNTSTFIGSSIFNSGFTANNVNGLVALPTSSCGLDLGCMLAGAISVILGAIFGFILGLIVGLIAFFVITVALIYGLFKLWFELLKAYISILVDIIFAPVWIVAGIIPGSGEKVGFGAWLRDMLGNLMAFPVAIAIFFLAAVFTQQFNANSTVFFLPPLIGPQANNFGPIIAFGLIMMSPGAVKIARQMFKSPTSGVGVGEGAGGFAAAAAIGGAVGSRLYYRDPRTGKAIGALANVQNTVSENVSNSRIARRVTSISPVRSVLDSRVINAFRSPDSKAARQATRDAQQTMPPEEVERRTRP